VASGFLICSPANDRGVDGGAADVDGVPRVVVPPTGALSCSPANDSAVDWCGCCCCCCCGVVGVAGVSRVLTCSPANMVSRSHTRECCSDNKRMTTMLMRFAHHSDIGLVMLDHMALARWSTGYWLEALREYRGVSNDAVTHSSIVGVGVVVVVLAALLD